MREVRKVQRGFQRALQEDRRRILQAVGSTIEGLMVTFRVNESWDPLVRWYRHARGNQAHPTREGLDRDLTVRAELYRCRPPARLKVPILVQSTVVSNEVPTESEVYMAVRGVRTGRSWDLSGMKTEDLKGWYKEAKRDKDPVGRIWYLVVRLVQVMFRDRTVPVEIASAKMVLIPKGRGGGGYRVICLVEVLWKFFAVVVNCWIKSSVMLNNTIHGFRTGRGTGTATLEAKLAQNLAGLAHKLLLQVLLYVQKAYDSM